jgi:hypothetical protein
VSSLSVVYFTYTAFQKLDLIGISSVSLAPSKAPTTKDPFPLHPVVKRDPVFEMSCI